MSSPISKPLSSFAEAEAPFNDPNADVVFRTSDGIDFHVYKIILTLASPFFRDMFSLTQPPVNHNTKTADAADPIVVSEKSDVMDSLFRLCYPVDDPLIFELDFLEHVLAAAMKYQLLEAIKLLTAKLQGFCSATACLPVYGIACRLNLEEQARHAARTHRETFAAVPANDSSFATTVASRCYDPRLAEITVGSYFRLVQHVRKFAVKPSGRKGFRKASSGCNSMQFDVFCTPPMVSSIAQSSGLQFIDTVDLDTDLVLRTSDCVEVAVHSVVLRLASAGQLLRLPRDADADAGKLPVIQLSFSHQVLCSLLSLCYMPQPGQPDKAKPNYWYTTRQLLQIAKQYSMAKIVAAVKDLVERDLMKTDPVSVYLFSIDNGWQDTASEAAKLTVYMDIEETYYPSMELYPAVSYYNLLKYRHECWSSALRICQKQELLINDWGDLKELLTSQVQKQAASNGVIVPLVIVKAASVTRKNILLGPMDGLKLTKSVSLEVETIMKEFSKELSSVSTSYLCGITKGTILTRLGLRVPTLEIQERSAT
ncbi:hypothetical protein EIP86_006269 [Pleurotus ostreatoroseus]|nr:hypothetical protein EIP86_006269 [Pleurotus ostreatoroseus]